MSYEESSSYESEDEYSITDPAIVDKYRSAGNVAAGMFDGVV